MRMTRWFGRTLREAPAEAETASHQLLLRSGAIDQLMAGVYTYLPLGWRVKRRVEAIVREEMDAAGALEIHMPAIQPLDIWERSGRADAMGPVLFRLTDQRDRPLALGPTHEEVVTQLFASQAQSYRDVPVTLYQIQTKFRDEARPRGGLVRVREFTMKDAYSFDADEAGLDASYGAMFEAYRRIFARCGVPTVPVEADSGAIGGKESREFVYLNDTGEDTIVICERCGYAANTEKAEFVRPPAAPEEPLDVEPVETPGTSTIEALAAFLGVPASKTAKAVFYMASDPHDASAAAEPVFVVVRGDLQVNEVKLRNLLGGKDLRPMTEAESASYGIVPGYASPVGIDERVRVVADTSVATSPNLVAGANVLGRHLRNVNLSREYQAHDVIDVALAEAGHTCGRCGEGVLGTARGIEMGHVFRLGYIYSEAFEARVLDEAGEQRTPIMGCYGLGVDRVVAGAVQEHHDERGIIWPASIAPFDVHLVGLGLGRDPDLAADADALYAELTAAGLEVLYDDRDESPGVKFNDADLIGVPLRLTASSRNLKAGVVEVLRRTGGDPDLVPRAEVASRVLAARAELLAALG
ncbi:MAG: proline--tRNA ligase [Dehalococcoidia bacterium]